MTTFDTITPDILTSPVRRTRELPAVTRPDSAGPAVRDARSELLSMALTNMVGEFTFYASTKARDENDVAELAPPPPVWDKPWRGRRSLVLAA